MTKVVIKTLSSARRARRPSSVAEKRIRKADGKIATIRTIDVNSRTFGGDLTYVFQRNVAKARRENKKVIGASDG
ncbi:MAG TPA: hypothetical protein VJR87_08615 [Allosphingosinicella sp.]|nr:hypothetical protein [Allosphingosinicella sp.]